jgi:hypothetical protein
LDPEKFKTIHLAGSSLTISLLESLAKLSFLPPPKCVPNVAQSIAQGIAPFNVMTATWPNTRMKAGLKTWHALGLALLGAVELCSGLSPGLRAETSHSQWL